jgi:hypothetical protein
MAQSYKAGILAASGSFNMLLVKKLVWSGAAATGDSLVITDGASVTLLTLIGQAAAPQEVNFHPPVRWRDFQLVTLSSGVVQVFLA